MRNANDGDYKELRTGVQSTLRIAEFSHGGTGELVVIWLREERRSMRLGVTRHRQVRKLVIASEYSR
jgi:hypothetical protein